jgi:His/Glu/Gln/Arg/opine family amino acid ABC transporter permease subunit
MGALGDYLHLLLRGAVVTVQISVLSYLLALALGLLGALVRVRKGGIAAKAIVLIYTTLVRGIPDIVLILLVYAGGQLLANAIARLAGLNHGVLSAFWAGVLAVGLIYGAYLVETFRGALLGVPRGQSEAARALGLGRSRSFLLVVLPQAMRRALPACQTSWQALMTSCAMVSVIGVDDVVNSAVDAGISTGQPTLFLGAALAFFLGMTWVSGLGFGQVSGRFARKGGNAVRPDRR